MVVEVVVVDDVDEELVEAELVVDVIEVVVDGTVPLSEKE